MSDWPYAHFQKEEMQCHCGCGGLPRSEFMEKLEAIRVLFGKPMTIDSAFRCAKYNAEVSSTHDTDGPHVRGLAADVRVFGEDAYELLYLALKNGMTGLGISQKLGSPEGGRYLHIDCVAPGDAHIPRPSLWSYA